MQKSDRTQTAKTVHRQPQASTTLNRRYVKRPARKVNDVAKNTDGIVSVGFKKQTLNIRSPKISHFGALITSSTTQKKEQAIQPAQAHPTQLAANQKMRERQQKTTNAQVNRPTAKELKDQAIKKALLAASKQTPQQAPIAQTIGTKGKTKKEKRMKFGLGRIVLAFSCATAAIFALVYFVNLNMPDIQFRAAAIQLHASYPNYVPHNYTPSGISSENGVVTIQFKNSTSDESFLIAEERSSWDSNALLNNYVKPTYGDEYTVLREKGLTIYANDTNATWVNGGIVYKLEVKNGNLSKKQISDIAVSF